MSNTPGILYEFATFCATDLNCNKSELFKNISDYLSYKNKQSLMTNTDWVIEALKKLLDIREFEVLVEPSETGDQIAALLLLHGNDAQKENALKYARCELKQSDEQPSKSEPVVVWEPPLAPKPEPCAILHYGNQVYSIPYTLLLYIVGWISIDMSNTAAPRVAISNTLKAFKEIVKSMEKDLQ